MRPKFEQSTNTDLKIIYASGNSTQSDGGIGLYKLDWPTLGSSNTPDPVTGRWPDKGYVVTGKTLRHSNGWVTAKNSLGQRRTWVGNVKAVGFNNPGTFDGAVSTATIDKLKNAALLELLGKVKEQDVNLAVVIGERKELAEMAVGTFVTVVRRLKRFRKDLIKRLVRRKPRVQADFKSAFDHFAARTRNRARRKLEDRLSAEPLDSLIERAGNPGLKAWLQWNYSISPLIGEIGSTIDATSRVRNTGIYTLRSGKTEQNVYNGDPLRTSGIGVKYRWVGGLVVRTEIGANLTISLEAPITAVAQSLGFTNPLSAGWELIPASFLLDGVGLPIGAWLDQLDVGIAHKFHGGSWYVKNTAEGSWTCSTFQDGGGWYSPEGKISCNSKTTVFNRTPFITWPTAGFSFDPPSFTDGLAKQLGSALAIAVQLINGGSTRTLRG